MAALSVRRGVGYALGNLLRARAGANVRRLSAATLESFESACGSAGLAALGLSRAMVLASANRSVLARGGGCAKGEKPGTLRRTGAPILGDDYCRARVGPNR